jgi:phospholipid transport system substrate-binding protein
MTFPKRLATAGRAALVACALVATGLCAPGPLGPTPARAASADGAADFIQQLGQDAVDGLARTDLSEEQRRQKFLDLLERGFAMEEISRFVLGRYWRVASADEQDRFQEVFKRVLAQRFLPLFEGYDRDDFEIARRGPDPSQPKLYAVTTQVARPGQTDGQGQMVEVVWRVRPSDGRYEIVDVKAEGVSMAITLRSEYNAAIQQAGGSVAALIDRLQAKLAEGAYTPQSAGDIAQ